MSGGLSGHLDLVCGRDAQGRSYLRKQSFRAPMHISKPHLDEGTLVVNVANPTAGLLAGDRIVSRVSVESGARLLLTAASASRAHCMAEEGASLTQEFSVAAGGWLESFPEMLIPQGGTRYAQRTVARVQEGGELMMIEMIAPGRVASGEAFAFTELDWECDIFLGSGRIARERYRLTPASPTLQAIRSKFPNAYYASCFIVTPSLTADAPCWRRIHDLHCENAWAGCSALADGAWAVRVLAADSVSLRKTVARMRREINVALDQREPSLRRT